MASIKWLELFTFFHNSSHFHLLKIQGEWKEKVVGAGAVTKDFSRKSYFIQIFDVQQRQKENR